MSTSSQHKFSLEASDDDDSIHLDVLKRSSNPVMEYRFLTAEMVSSVALWLPLFEYAAFGSLSTDKEAMMTHRWQDFTTADIYAHLEQNFQTNFHVSEETGRVTDPGDDRIAERASKGMGKGDKKPEEPYTITTVHDISRTDLGPDDVARMQVSGTCTWRSAQMVFFAALPYTEYKLFELELKMDAVLAVFE